MTMVHRENVAEQRTSKMQVQMDVRNSKVRKQDKFRKDWPRCKNICKSQSVCPEEYASSVGMPHTLQMFYGNIAQDIRFSYKFQFSTRVKMCVTSDKWRVTMYMVILQHVG